MNWRANLNVIFEYYKDIVVFWYIWYSIQSIEIEARKPWGVSDLSIETIETLVFDFYVSTKLVGELFIEEVEKYKKSAILKIFCLSNYAFTVVTITRSL